MATIAQNWNEKLVPPPQGEGGFDACWYPVALSSEVLPGKIHGTEFLDGRVIVVRGADGKPSVLSAYCRHYGADLVDGDIADDCVRCPFHHWRYDMSGVSVATAVGDPPPANAKLFAFPTREKWGLIWAFNGDEPTYDVPSWAEDESERFVTAAMVADYRGDPFLATLNVIDVQHLRSLHGLDVSDIVLTAKGNSFHVDMTISGEYIGMPRITRHAQIVGTNAVVYSKASIGIDTIAGATPFGNGRSRLYIATSGLRSAFPEQVIEEKVLERAQASQEVILQDLPILDRIRFRVDSTTKSDQGVVQFLRFAVRHPRAHPSQEYIT